MCARCFLALWGNEPVAFCAVIPLMGFPGRRRVSRIVTLPDFQGIGIGTAFLKAVAEILHEENLRLSITASHPSIINHCATSPSWKTTNFIKPGRRSGVNKENKKDAYQSRSMVSFEFTGTSDKYQNNKYGKEKNDKKTRSR